MLDYARRAGAVLGDGHVATDERLIGGMVEIVVLDGSHDRLGIIREQRRDIALRVDVQAAFPRIVRPVVRIEEHRQVKQSGLIDHGRIVADDVIGDEQHVVLARIVLEHVRIVDTQVVQRMAFHDQVVLVVIDGIGEGCCRLSLIGGRLFAERGAVDDVELAPEFRELADDAFALLRPVRAVDQQIGARRWRTSVLPWSPTRCIRTSSCCRAHATSG